MNNYKFFSVLTILLFANITFATPLKSGQVGDGGEPTELRERSAQVEIPEKMIPFGFHDDQLTKTILGIWNQENLEKKRLRRENLLRYLIYEMILNVYKYNLDEGTKSFFQLISPEVKDRLKVQREIIDLALDFARKIGHLENSRKILSDPTQKRTFTNSSVLKTLKINWDLFERNILTLEREIMIATIFHEFIGMAGYDDGAHDAPEGMESNYTASSVFAKIMSQGRKNRYFMIDLDDFVRAVCLSDDHFLSMSASKRILEAALLLPTISLWMSRPWMINWREESQLSPLVPLLLGPTCRENWEKSETYFEGDYLEKLKDSFVASTEIEIREVSVILDMEQYPSDLDIQELDEFEKVARQKMTTVNQLIEQAPRSIQIEQ